MHEKTKLFPTVVKVKGRERTVRGDAEPPLGLKMCSRARQGGRGCILVQETCCCTTCIEKGAAAFDMLQELIKEVHGISALADQRGAVAKNLEVYYERYYRSLSDTAC